MTSRRVLKNTIALTVANVGQLAGNIVLLFYLSRMLQVEGLGIYATVMAIFQTVSIGCGIGFNSFLPRELPKDLSQTNRYLIHASLVAVASAVALAIGLDLLVPYLGYMPLTRTGIYVISWAFIPVALQTVLNATFVAHQKAELITVTGLFEVLGRILVSLLILRLGFGVTGLIVVYTAFSYVMSAVAVLFLIRYVVKPHWEFDWPFLSNMLHELRVFAALTLLSALFAQSEVIILSLTRGETQVGLYSAALKLVTVWTMVPSSYMTAMFPVLSAAFQESRQKAVNIQNRSIKYMFALVFPLATGMTVAADAIILQFYGPAFRESIQVLRLLSWYLVLSSCNAILWRVLVARDEQRVVFRGQLITEILQAFLAFWLTPQFGYQGAAWALMGGNLAYTVYHAYYVQRDKTPLPLVQLAWRFALASAVMGAFTWMGAQWLHLFVLVPMAAAVYLAMILALRAFSPDDVALFQQMLKLKAKAQPARQEVAAIDSVH